MFELLWWHFPLFFIVGVVVSFSNALAGGGSILSLPILLFFGADPAYANGTNRIGVLMGTGGAVVKFRKEGFLADGELVALGIPTMIGSIIGTVLVLDIKAAVFKAILAVVILSITVLIFNRERLGRTRKLAVSPGSMKALKSLVAFIAGFYGGFIQVGMGFVLIFLFSFTHELDLLRTNALKSFVSFLFLLVSTMIFIVHGTVSYSLGIAMGLGNFAGGYLGSHFQIRFGVVWVERFLLVMGVLMSAKLLAESLSF